MAQPIERNEKITANTECGIGTGHVHTVVGTDRLFVQLTVGTTLVNKYIAAVDENKTWVRGHDVEKLQAALSAEVMAEPPKR